MTSTAHTPHLIVLMGVAGSGKTTLGRLLAERLGYTFIDADDFHSTEAVARMRNAIPLTDAMRNAWVDRVHTALVNKYQEGTNCVLAFSGLRARHRRQLMHTGFIVSAFMLRGSDEMLTQRLEQRRGHFMPATQLQDQLTSMEPVEADEQIEFVDIKNLPDDIVEAMENKVRRLRSS